jgi:hypothetical protein
MTPQLLGLKINVWVFYSLICSSGFHQRRKAMKLSVVFTIASIFLIILGLAQLLAPAAMLAAAGTGGSSSSAFLITVRFSGVEMLGLGIIAWLVRNADASRARDGLTLGFTIYFALHALTSLYGQFADTSTSVHWIMATLQALMAVGFFMAGRASMSTRAS